jgi:hypothetical protein
VRWEDVDWRKLYLPPTWSRFFVEVSLEARGLFYALMLAVDKAGLMDCGSDPIGTVCRAVNGHPDRVPAYLDELTSDGCIVLNRNESGRTILVIPNYLEAQTARSSDAKRKEQSRARAREQALAVRDERQLSMPPELSRTSVRAATPCHTKPSNGNPAYPESRSQSASEPSKDSKHSILSNLTPPAILDSTECVVPSPVREPEAEAALKAMHAMFARKVEEP